MPVMYEESAFDARKSTLAELRFFSGLSIEETAHVMGISTATVERALRCGTVESVSSGIVEHPTTGRIPFGAESGETAVWLSRSVSLSRSAEPSK